MKTIFLLVLFFLLISSPIAFAASSYILPYPSVMPGSIFYKLRLLQETIEKYWYFGDFGQFDYNLKESDKYLVEAKTLFEYQQYFLGYKALQKSNYYFRNISQYLTFAQKNHKDITEKRSILHQAAVKHIEVLNKLIHEVPSEFVWKPEKGSSTPLPLKTGMQRAIETRKEIL